MPVGVMMQEPEKERSENTAAIPEGVESKVDIKHRFEEQEILRYFLHSADFRKAAMSGNYIYVDGFIVLNSPRCIHRMRSQPRVLPGALRNPERYLLQIKNITFFDGPLDPTCIGPQKRRLPKTLITQIQEAAQIGSIELYDKENIALIVGGGGGGGGGDPALSALNRKIVYEMDRSSITVRWLAEESGMSEKTIQRMRNDPEYRPSLQTIVAVCLGMHLYSYEADSILLAAGYVLTGITIERIYRAMLNLTYKTNMREINTTLERLGYPKFEDKE